MKYARVVQDMYKGSETVVSCAPGDRWVQGGDGIISGIISELLLFLMLDRLAEEIRQDSPWTMVFADDTDL